MRRSIRRFFDSLHGARKYLFFIALILVCIVALCLGIYAQFFYKYSDTDAFMIGINIGSQKNAEEKAIIKKLHNQDVAELSYFYPLSKVAIKKNCSNAYEYNAKKQRFELKTDMIYSNDMPSQIKY